MAQCLKLTIYAASIQLTLESAFIDWNNLSNFSESSVPDDLSLTQLIDTIGSTMAAFRFHFLQLLAQKSDVLLHFSTAPSTEVGLPSLVLVPDCYVSRHSGVNPEAIACQSMDYKTDFIIVVIDELD